MQEPIVPRGAVGKRCLVDVRPTDPPTACWEVCQWARARVYLFVQAVAHFPTVNQYAFEYLIEFLRDVLRHSIINGIDVEWASEFCAVALSRTNTLIAGAVFADVMFEPLSSANYRLLAAAFVARCIQTPTPEHTSALHKRHRELDE
jgi:hypothetical protein